MDNCIFCKIIAGEIPCTKVYENDNVISFLDIMPANKGHCLVIPKKHSETLIETEDAILNDIIQVTKKVAKAISLSLGNKSYNIIQNNGKASGQVVNHIHFHIIPRFAKDGLKLSLGHKKYSGDEITKYADKIKKFLD
tara:strand:+ start:8787 stop:9200 length:414 start_codon:yes stop_codon:yes gene_type:complete